jgi:hypothetical protein
VSTPVTVDRYANKAVVAAVGTIVTVLLRWLVSHDLQLDDEGLIALAGAITTLLVWAVSNWRSVFDRSRSQAGQVGPISVLLWLLVAVVIVVLIVWLVGFIR